MKTQKKYPFQEGDDYWVIEDGKPIWSCWDYISEELYDENPNKLLFSSEADAIAHINTLSDLESQDWDMFGENKI